MTFSDFLDDEQQEWRSACHRFIDEQIGREYVRECDRERQYYSEGYAKLAAAGYIGLLIPEEYGGSGGTNVAYAVLCEAMGKYGVDFAIAACVSTFSAMNLIHYGTPEQIAAYIPRFLDGSVSFCVAISEPEAGSDAAAASTRAVRDGDHYVLTGLKQWCSGSSAPGAHIFTLVRTDPEAAKHAGLSVILVPNDLPDMELRKLKTLARRATGTNQIFLDGTRVPATGLIGAEGQGWEIVTRHLLLERIAIAAAYVGCAQQAVDDACRYALERQQFGQALFEFQALSHMLADMQTKVDAARLLVYRAAAMADAGSLAAREVAMAKLFASEALQSVSRDGVQIMGGAGMLPEADMERYFREGMQATIGGGTSQIQRNIIARSMGTPAPADMNSASEIAPPSWFSRALSLTPEPLDIRRDGRNVRVYRWGDPSGRPLILLHGFGANAHWWDHIGPQLVASGLQVAAVDLAGHGESDYAAEYTLTGWAADVAEVYERLSPLRPLLIGHSAGGRIGWKVAELYGADLLAVVSVDGPVPPPAPQPDAAGLRSRFRRGHRVYPDRDEILRRFQLRPDQAALPYVLQHIAEHSVRPVAGGWTWAHDARIYHRPRTDEIVARPLNCPLFLLLAEKGRITAEAASVIRPEIPHMSVSTIPAAAHHVMLDQPLALVSVLRLITDLMTSASQDSCG